jgi:hypothetical protein
MSSVSVTGLLSWMIGGITWAQRVLLVFQGAGRDVVDRHPVGNRQQQAEAEAEAAEHHAVDQLFPV